MTKGKEWVKINYDTKVPVGAHVAKIYRGNNTPQYGWYSPSTNQRTFVKIENGLIHYKNTRMSDGDFTIFKFSLQDGHWYYLREYKPYDPDQEPEDDCL